jgi:hypothetical protein
MCYYFHNKTEVVMSTFPCNRFCTVWYSLDVYVLLSGVFIIFWLMNWRLFENTSIKESSYISVYSFEGSTLEYLVRRISASSFQGDVLSRLWIYPQLICHPSDSCKSYKIVSWIGLEWTVQCQALLWQMVRLALIPWSRTWMAAWVYFPLGNC